MDARDLNKLLTVLTKISLKPIPRKVAKPAKKLLCALGVLCEK